MELLTCSSPKWPMQPWHCMCTPKTVYMSLHKWRARAPTNGMCKPLQTIHGHQQQACFRRFGGRHTSLHTSRHYPRENKQEALSPWPNFVGWREDTHPKTSPPKKERKGMKRLKKSNRWRTNDFQRLIKKLILRFRKHRNPKRFFLNPHLCMSHRNWIICKLLLPPLHPPIINILKTAKNKRQRNRNLSSKTSQWKSVDIDWDHNVLKELST